MIISDNDRLEFFNSKIPINGVQVWIGRYKGVEFYPTRLKKTIMPLLKKRESGLYFVEKYIESLTIVMDNIIVFGTFETDKIEFRMPNHFSGYLTQIWPNKYLLCKWPGVPVCDSMAFNLAEYLERFYAKAPTVLYN